MSSDLGGRYEDTFVVVEIKLHLQSSAIIVLSNIVKIT